MKTFQQVFDIVAAHLLTQNKQALSDKEGCAYRGEEGTKCAIGVLIKDNCYFSTFEGDGVGDSPKVQRALKKSGIPTDMVSIDRLVKLQTIHDVFKPQEWPTRLRIFAKNHHLSAKVVGETLKKINK